MMRFVSFGLILAFSATAHSAALPYTHVVHEKRDAASSKQWVKRENLSSTAVLTMRIGLKQRNLDCGHDFLKEM
jgi:tripeptidyl-peptidase-1